MMGGCSMKIFKSLILITVVTMSIYSLMTENYSYIALTSLLIGIYVGILGVEEFMDNGKNSWAIFYLPVSMLIISMAAFSF